MTIIHLFSTAVVGGQTGKSTSSMMLAAYLCRQQHPTQRVAMLDLSHNARMYKRLSDLFGSPEKVFIGNVQSFLVGTHADRCHKQLLIGGMSNYLESDKMVECVRAFNDAVTEEFGGAAPDHIILETNLPRDVLSHNGFLDDLRGGPRSPTKLFAWTTWVTDGLAEKSEYDSYQTLTAGRRNSIQIFFIHNPFAGTSGHPEDDFSISMSNCYELVLSEEYDAARMWGKCGHQAKEAENQAFPTSEERWSYIYAPFLTEGKRPRNLLPIYRSSENWKKAILNGFKITLSCPEELYGLFTGKSDGICSQIYAPFFEGIGL